MAWGISAVFCDASHAVWGRIEGIKAHGTHDRPFRFPAPPGSCIAPKRPQRATATNPFTIRSMEEFAGGDNLRRPGCSMKTGSKLVIIGDGEFARIAHEYFTHDSPHTVVGFAVERDFLKSREYLDLPVVPFEELENHFSPAEHKAFVAITYTQLNRVRTRLYRGVKARGFEVVSYVSSRAFVWHNVKLGENVFVFENNVIQHFAEIGNNVILWSGNHIGHRTVIEDHCYLTSHVVVSGYCRIQESSFVGVNATIADRVTVARDCFIGAGCVIGRDTQPGKIYQAPAPQIAKVGSLRFMKVRDDDDSST
jgi:sugar O-acyltransferase (sialic acid O-acetyltransferase NeuD family)